MSVGGVGGVGGGGAAAGVGGAAAPGGSAGGGVASVGSTSSVGDPGPADSAGSSPNDTKAVEQGGYPLAGPQMSTQDFCALKTQAAQPVEQSPEIDLQKMLEWLMAIKLLESMSEK